jgi:chitinase
MSYDLMNRRDNATKHHTSIAGSLAAVNNYISRGMAASKMNLGFAFYAKWFTTAPRSVCSQPIGCPTALLENASTGADTGMSGVLTFEANNFLAVPSSLTTSSDGTCGSGTARICPSSTCCSQYGSW